VTLTADEANVGSNALVVDNNGKVGVGLSSGLVRKFEVQSDGGQVRISDTDGSFGELFTNAGEFTIRSTGNGGGAIDGFITFDVTSSGTTTEKMRIDSTGKVGIGTTSSDHQLHVRAYGGKICVEGIGSDYSEGVFLSKNKGGASRGGGLAMKSTDSAGNNHVEWYVGRPYASNDKLIIARQTGDSTEGRSVAQSSRALVTVQSNGVTLIQTPTGYCEIGSKNSSWCHFYTDRPKFYFNKQCQAVSGFVTYSDERLKENVTVVENAVESIKKIRGVTFTWKQNADSQERPEGKRFGVLAQEVLQIDPEMCEQPEAVSDGDEKFYTFDYSNLTPYFIEAIKEQQATIESQQAKIDSLEAEIQAIKDHISYN
jgi:hypothetical protein